jgi:GTP-binding protein HflX
LIGRRIATLKENLERIDRQRATQSKRRQDLYRIALVGYTNAGKSTLMNRLTETDVLAEDRLFATLDSTVRRWQLFNRTVLLSDTVGFIRKLPHHLVESFKSTLDEVRDADLLLHVVDAGSPAWDEHIEVVEETLEELGAADKPVCLVFNKVDRVDELRIQQLRQAYPEAKFVSAERGIGIDQLRKTIDQSIEKGYHPFSVTIPMSEFNRVIELRRVAVIENESYDDATVTLKGRIDERFDRLLEEAC